MSRANRLRLSAGIVLALALLAGSLELYQSGLDGVSAIVKSNLLGWPSPVFISNVHVDPEGSDGFRVWFALADANRRDTAATGEANIQIRMLIDRVSIGTAFSHQYKVRYADFSYWTFEQLLNGHRFRRLIWSSNRISYDDLGEFKHYLGLGGSQLSGTAEVEFTTSGGAALKGTSPPFRFQE
jgi:hypothetical protein